MGFGCAAGSLNVTWSLDAELVASCKLSGENSNEKVTRTLTVKSLVT